MLIGAIVPKILAENGKDFLETMFNIHKKGYDRNTRPPTGKLQRFFTLV